MTFQKQFFERSFLLLPALYIKEKVNLTSGVACVTRLGSQAEGMSGHALSCRIPEGYLGGCVGRCHCSMPPLVSCCWNIQRKTNAACPGNQGRLGAAWAASQRTLAYDLLRMRHWGKKMTRPQDQDFVQEAYKIITADNRGGCTQGQNFLRNLISFSCTCFYRR